MVHVHTDNSFDSFYDQIKHSTRDNHIEHNICRYMPSYLSFDETCNIGSQFDENNTFIVQETVL